MKQILESGIYCIVNLTNNKKYIGSAKVISRRWSEHKKYLRKNSHKNKHLQSAWNLYGEDNFSFVVLELVEFDLLIEREIFWLEEISNTEEVYNINFNVKGFHGRKHTEETKKKISDTKKSQNNKTIHSEETRKKISQSLTGKKKPPLSEEHKIKISANSKRQPCSEETKQAIKEKNSTDYYLKDPQGNTHIGKNINEFCRINNLSSKAISIVNLGKRRQHKGWTSLKFDFDLNQNKNFKNFTLLNPDGVLIEGNNLSQFCRENNLSYNCIQRVLNGERNSHLGYKKA